MKEYEIGNKITRNHAFKVNILAVATISSEHLEYTFYTSSHSVLLALWACDTLIQDFSSDQTHFELR